MEVGGSDSNGREFKNAEEMWRDQAGDPSKKTEWYRQGVGYWQGVEASVDGVLGGYGHVNEADIQGSEAFLSILLSERFSNAGTDSHLVALDCGSGIGRVTKNLLIRYFNEDPCSPSESIYLPLLTIASLGTTLLTTTFIIRETQKPSFVYSCPAITLCRHKSLCSSSKASTILGAELGQFADLLLSPQVDLLEPVSHFLEAARENLAPENHTSSDMHKATNFFCMPLQEFTPDAGRYDIIWVQWCIGHLTDDDFVTFFKRAKVGLKPGGFIVLKENIARTGFVLDNEDRSITRSDLYYKELFSQCGLHIYKSKDQTGMPEELFAVKMYALTTDSPKRVHRTRSKVQANRPRIIK